MTPANEAYSPGDVFWAPDPYNTESEGPRPWLVLAASGLPFPGEEYICAALTLSDLDANLAIGDQWVAGGNPDRSRTVPRGYWRQSNTTPW